MAKKLLIGIILALAAAIANAQTHVTQPFHIVIDEPTVNVNGTANQVQVNHFLLKIDGATPINIGLPTGAPSSTPGFTSFSVLAPTTLANGNHSIVATACSTTDDIKGCADSGPLAFVLDPAAPPAPSVRVAP